MLGAVSNPNPNQSKKGMLGAGMVCLSSSGEKEGERGFVPWMCAFGLLTMGGWIGAWALGKHLAPPAVTTPARISGTPSNPEPLEYEVCICFARHRDGRAGDQCTW